ncbi:uncharacterized protein [Dysidea avara]|uniref:uncharacterized protein isoform X2 n=1 Tax=Dysidea avara TaxID=196820 RepID=UPI00331B6CC5
MFTTTINMNVIITISIMAGLLNMVSVSSGMGSKNCKDAVTVGSTNDDENIVDEDTTYILTDKDYKVGCTGVVIAWEFCYQVQNVSKLTFYPGIWEENKKTYLLVQSSIVTFTPTDSMSPCQMFTVPETDRFQAPKDSFVGLYSNMGLTRPLLLADNDNGKTYQVSGNRSTIDTKKLKLKGEKFNIAIRAHIMGTAVVTFPPITMLTTSSTITITATTTGVVVTNSGTTISTANITCTNTVLGDMSITSSTMSTAIVTALSGSQSTPQSSVVDDQSFTAPSSASVTAAVVPSTTSHSETPVTDSSDVSSTSIISTSMLSSTTSGMGSSLVSSSITSDVITASTLTTSTPTLINSDTATTIPSAISGVGTGNGGSSSSGGAGVIAGVVVGILICIIVILLIILGTLWYYKRGRKRMGNAPQGSPHYHPSSSPDKLVKSKASTDHEYSRPGAGESVTIKDAAYEAIDNHNYYSSVDYTTSNGVGGNSEVYIPYLDPVQTIKGQPKVTSSDYQSSDYQKLPSLEASTYSNPNYEKQAVPYEYETSTLNFNSGLEDEEVYAEALPEGEKIYEDPGHIEEHIYAWFEERKFRKLKKDNIKTLHKLGSGEFGVVNLGLWTDGSTDPKQVAVKTLNSNCLESDRVKFLREAAIMGQFQHNNVVQLHGVVTEEENMMIVLEYMPKGDLREFLLDMKQKTSPEVHDNMKHDLLGFCRQISAGLNYLSSKHFIHRDLAARNVLVSSDDVCKIADFGMARDVADDIYYVTTGGKIPVKWTALEAILYKKYSTRSDVWSFGCVMYEVWSLGHKPFEKLSLRQYVEKITAGHRLPPPPGCPRAVYEVMIQCWHPDPKQRPLSGMILKTLQKPDGTLLATSEVTTSNGANQTSMTLGAPLAAGHQLHLDLQHSYTTD